jgi:hypothetical protein
VSTQSSFPPPKSLKIEYSDVCTGALLPLFSAPQYLGSEPVGRVYRCANLFILPSMPTWNTRMCVLVHYCRCSSHPNISAVNQSGVCTGARTCFSLPSMPTWNTRMCVLVHYCRCSSHPNISAVNQSGVCTGARTYFSCQVFNMEHSDVCTGALLPLFSPPQYLGSEPVRRVYRCENLFFLPSMPTWNTRMCVLVHYCRCSSHPNISAVNQSGVCTGAISCCSSPVRQRQHRVPRCVRVLGCATWR